MELPGETVVFLRVRPGNVERALQDLRKHASVRTAEPTLGSYDMVVTGAFRDDGALRAFVREVEAKEYCDGCEARPSFRQWAREGAKDVPLQGWTLIQARNSEAAMKSLQSVAAVNRIYEVPGEFNLVANVAAESPAKLMEALTKGIHRIEGIRRTQTLAGFREPKPPAKKP